MLVRLLPIFLLCTGRALAAAGEHSICTGVGYHRLSLGPGDSGNGLGVFVGYRYGLSDDWYLDSRFGYGGYVTKERRFGIVFGALSAVYLIDVTSFIPEISLGIGYAGPTSDSGLRHDLFFKLGVALEYRRVRPFGIGIVGEYKVFVRNRERARGDTCALVYVAKYF